MIHAAIHQFKLTSHAKGWTCKTPKTNMTNRYKQTTENAQTNKTTKVTKSNLQKHLKQ